MSDNTLSPTPVMDHPVEHSSSRWYHRVVDFANQHALVIVAGVLIFAITFGLRSFRLAESFDVFIDEVTYFELADTVRQTGWPELYGEPFHLHPPAQFYFEALFIQITQPVQDLFEQIYTVRYLNIIYASLTAVALFDISRRLVGITWGVLAGILFALDAFIIRNNSLNLLDTGTLWWVTLGYWLLISGLQNDDSQLSLRRILAIGITFGLGMLTKDMAAFLTIVPLGGMFVTGWFLPRLHTFLIGTLTAMMYAIYPVAVFLMGEWDYFFDDKFSGLIRLIGLEQSTGLNRSEGPSLISKVIEKLIDFGMTYSIIAAGGLAVIVLLIWGGRRAKILATWCAGSYLMMSYSVLFGTLEEQFFYFLVVPAIPTVVVMINKLLELTESRTRLRLTLVGTVLLALVVFVSSSTQAWIVQHFTPNNGYEQVYDYLRRYVPPGADVASSSETGQFIFGSYAAGPWGTWHTLEELAAYQPEYVMLNYDQLDWDYGAAALPMIEWVEQNGLLLLDHNSPNNHFALYQINATELLR